MLTESDISACLSPRHAGYPRLVHLSRALVRSLMASLQMSANHGLLKHFGTAEVLGIVFFAMSF